MTSTSAGGGWTRCGNVNEVAADSDVSVEELDPDEAYPSSPQLTNTSFCAKFFTATSAKSLLVHNVPPTSEPTSAATSESGISWKTGPTLYDYAAATPIELCENISSGTLWSGCRYVSHANDPRAWQLSAWSFGANSPANPYSTLADRILLGVTFRKDGAATNPVWHNFGAETNATNLNNKRGWAVAPSAICTFVTMLHGRDQER